MVKKVKLRILINFNDKENGTEYKRNDEVYFSEKRAEELLKNPCLVEKIEEIKFEKIGEQNENKTESTEKQTDNKTEK